MPFDSNGTFNRVRAWVSDAAASIKIRADYHDVHDSDIASGLTQCLTKDGRTQPTANIPMNQKKLVNLGEPEAPADAATKKYVDSFKTFTTGAIIDGAGNPNGMVQFTATTGTTGLSFANSAMSWVSKPAEATKWRARLAVTNLAGGAGSELVYVDKGGYFNFNVNMHLAHNYTYDGTDWRVNVTGTGTILTMYGGTLRLYQNLTATLEDNAVAVPAEFFTVSKSAIKLTSDTHAELRLSHKGVNSINQIIGMKEGENRWLMRLGNGATEAGAAGNYSGSDFDLYAYDNSGAGITPRMAINRASGETTFWGTIRSSQNFQSYSSNVVLAGSGGNVYLRPNGAASAADEAYLDSAGNFVISTGNFHVNNANNAGALLGRGQRGRNGMFGAYSANWHNWLWSSGMLYALVDNANVGRVSFVCDYRIKRNIKPLPSMWDKVKGLNPISYNPKKYGHLFEDSDEERWGLIAHEVQEKLLPSAASFKKDQKDAIQSPDIMAIIAALTKALQEAQARIEALEAKLA